MNEADGQSQSPASQLEPAEFLELWSGSFSQVLGQITGSAFPSSVENDLPADLAAAGEGDLWAVVTASGALRGEMNLRLTAASVLRLAQIFMSEPATPEAQPTGEHREAVLELLRQIAGTVSTAAKVRWGEVQLSVEPSTAAPSWPPASTLWVRAGDPGPTGMIIEFVLSATLVAQLRTEKAEAGKAESVKAATLSGTAPPDTNSGSGTLDLLMDVQLAMTLRFGAKTLLLREVLDLSPGTVVELDRRAQEPVELLLDGRLIARGEVVVIEGSYGLRVTEVSHMGSN